MAWLQVCDLVGSKRKIELETEEMNIGREPDNDVVLADHQVSRHHARLVATGQGWLLEDMGSANGTWIAGQRITRQVLLIGDSFKIGSTTFQMEDLVTVLGSLEERVPIVASFPSTCMLLPLPPLPPPIQVPCIAPPVPPLPPLIPPSFMPPPTLQVSPSISAVPPPLPVGLLPPPLPQHPSFSGNPSAPSQQEKSIRGGYGLAIGMGCLGLLLGGLLVAGYFLRPMAVQRLFSKPGSSSSSAPSLSLPGFGAVPGISDAETAAANFERAMAAGDLEGAMAFVEPSHRATLRESFSIQPDRMKQTAAIMSSRKLLKSDASRAEFEVNENGRTFTIVFHYTAGTWMLSAF